MGSFGEGDVEYRRLDAQPRARAGGSRRVPGGDDEDLEVVAMGHAAAPAGARLASFTGVDLPGGGEWDDSAVAAGASDLAGDVEPVADVALVPLVERDLLFLRLDASPHRLGMFVLL